MTNDKVTKLTAHTSSLGYKSTPDSYLGQIDAFVLEHELFDLDGDIEDDLELDSPRPDEVRLGPLTSFERRNYAMAMVADSIIKDTLVEFEASHADAIVTIMRKHKLPYHSAVQRHIAEIGHSGLTSDQQVYITQLSLVLATCMSAYEFGVRSRFSEFKRRLIVRTNFTVWAFQQPTE